MAKSLKRQAMDAAARAYGAALDNGAGYDAAMVAAGDAIQALLERKAAACAAVECEPCLVCGEPFPLVVGDPVCPACAAAMDHDAKEVAK